MSANYFGIKTGSLGSFSINPFISGNVLHHISSVLFIRKMLNSVLSYMCSTVIFWSKPLKLLIVIKQNLSLKTVCVFSRMSVRSLPFSKSKVICVVQSLSQRSTGPFLPGYGGFKIGSWQSVTLLAIVDLHKLCLISLIGAQIVL